ncbi:MAG: hypothetical protein IPI14_12695 [Polaromonas sp.]|nr:hypothetical protein [Polaromonas sp.]
MRSRWQVSFLIFAFFCGWYIVHAFAYAICTLCRHRFDSLCRHRCHRFETPWSQPSGEQLALEQERIANLSWKDLQPSWKAKFVRPRLPSHTLDPKWKEPADFKLGKSQATTTGSCQKTIQSRQPWPKAIQAPRSLSKQAQGADKAMFCLGELSISSRQVCAERG